MKLDLALQYESKDTQRIFNHYRNKYFIVVNEIGEDSFNALLDDSFIRAWKNFDEKKENAHFGKFLCGSIQFNINNILRTRQRESYIAEHNKLSLNAIVSRETMYQTEFIDTIESEGNDYSTLDINSTLQFIGKVVGLNSEEMLVLKYHIIDGMKVTDIEKYYGIGYRTLNNTCKRIKNRMKKDKEFMKEVRELCIS